jgi:hypothetical protein
MMLAEVTDLTGVVSIVRLVIGGIILLVVISQLKGAIARAISMAILEKLLNDDYTGKTTERILKWANRDDVVNYINEQRAASGEDEDEK